MWVNPRIKCFNILLNDAKIYIIIGKIYKHCWCRKTLVLDEGKRIRIILLSFKDFDDDRDRLPCIP